MGLAQDKAMASDCVDTHASGTCQFKFPAQFAHKDVNDLWLWLVKTAIGMAEEGCIAQTEPLSRARNSTMRNSLAVSGT